MIEFTAVYWPGRWEPSIRSISGPKRCPKASGALSQQDMFFGESENIRETTDGCERRGCFCLIWGENVACRVWGKGRAEPTDKSVGRDGMGRVMENNYTVSCSVRDNCPG